MAKHYLTGTSIDGRVWWVQPSGWTSQKYEATVTDLDTIQNAYDDRYKANERCELDVTIGNLEIKTWTVEDQQRVDLADRKRRICIGYLLAGNSGIDLAEQLIEQITSQQGPAAYEQFYQEIEQNLKDAQEQDPAMETSAETELEILFETYRDHEYEANSPVWS